MIQFALLFGLGFLSASLLVMLIAPAIHGRIVRYTEKRIQATLPISPQEVRAQRDMARAVYAAENARTKQELVQERDQTVGLKLRYDKLAEEARRLQSDNHDLQMQINDMDVEAADLRSRLRQEDSYIQQLKAAVEAAEEADAAKGVQIEDLQRRVAKLTADGDNFRIELRGTHYDSRVDAAHALARWAHDSDLKWAPKYATRDYGVIGRISGFDVHLGTRPMLGDLLMEVTLDDVPRSGFTLSRELFLEGGVGVIQRIENRVSGIPTLLGHALEDLAIAEQTIGETEERIGQPFRYAAALADAETDLSRVEAQLAAMQDSGEQPTAVEEARITVEAVRAHRPALGVRSDPDRAVADLAMVERSPAPQREGPQFGL